MRTRFSSPRLHRRQHASIALRLGIVIVGLAVFIALFPSLFSSYDPNTSDYTAMLQAPSKTHLFGTDNYGRDLFARVVWGTRVDLLLGVGCVIVPFLFGSALGLLAGYYGGKTDAVIMRILDIFMALQSWETEPAIS